MDNPLQLKQALLLVVVFAPLAAALLVATAGRSSPRTARRLALGFAVLHLGLSSILAGVMTLALGNSHGASATFHPQGVPGDPSGGPNGESDLDTGATTWSLLTLTPGTATAAAAEVQLYLGLDGLNVWLVLLTSVMSLVAVLVSWDTVAERPSSYYAWLLVLQAAVLGAFTAFDVVLFYVFFELTLIPAFFLIGSWGVGSARRVAARKFFLYTLFGSLLTLTGLVGVVLTNPTPLDRLGKPIRVFNGDIRSEVTSPKAGPLTFSIPRLMENVSVWSEVRVRQVYRARAAVERARVGLSTARSPDDEAREQAALASATALQAQADDAFAGRRLVQTWLFFALMCGFAVKIPIVPFHTWLPGAYAEAPLAVTMLLSALLAKLGTYGVLRVVLPLTPEPAIEYGLAVFGTLGAVGIVYAAFCAFAQRDLKLLVAYSSVSHLGFLVMALFTYTPEGVSGAALHMVNHGLSTGAMFALLGFLALRYRTLDSNQYGGLLGRFPAFSFWFFVVSLASIGLPGLNNFVSEMLMLAGLMEPAVRHQAGPWLAVAGAVGILLSAWYTLTMIRRVFFGPLREPVPPVGQSHPDVPARLTGREAAAFALPAGLCLLLGLYPQPVLDTIRPDAAAVTEQGNLARQRLRLETPGVAERYAGPPRPMAARP